MNTKILIITTVTMLSLLFAGCAKQDSDENANVETPTDPTAPTTPVDPYKTAGWYGRTTVSATAADGKVYSHTTAGVFGELIQSSDDQDEHDIPGYGAAVLQVIFLPEFSTDTTAGYFGEYKSYDGNEARKVWTFQVKNQKDVDLSNAPITLSLANLFDVRYKDDNGSITYKESKENNMTLMQQLTLVDVDNQMTYSVEELQSADLKMQDSDGNPVHTRTFRWVLGSVDSSDYEMPASPQRAAGRNAPAAVAFQAAPAKTGGKFGLPPQ